MCLVSVYVGCIDIFTVDGSFVFAALKHRIHVKEQIAQLLGASIHACKSAQLFIRVETPYVVLPGGHSSCTSCPSSDCCCYLRVETML